MVNSRERRKFRRLMERIAAIAAAQLAERALDLGATQSSPRKSRDLPNKTFYVLVGLATMLGALGYAVEKWYETKATIDLVGDIDQKAPFSIPLDVHNRSTFFSMKSAVIACHIQNEYSDDKRQDLAEKGSQWATPASLPIEPGKSQIFLCDFPDRFLYTGETGETIPLKKATMEIGLSYDTTLLIWQMHRHVEETFMAYRTPAGLHWVKGKWFDPPHEGH
jgi:hypothetical protein